MFEEGILSLVPQIGIAAVFIAFLVWQNRESNKTIREHVAEIKRLNDVIAGRDEKRIESLKGVIVPVEAALKSNGEAMEAVTPALNMIAKALEAGGLRALEPPARRR